MAGQAVWRDILRDYDPRTSNGRSHHAALVGIFVLGLAVSWGAMAAGVASPDIESTGGEHISSDGASDAGHGGQRAGDGGAGTSSEAGPLQSDAKADGDGSGSDGGSGSGGGSGSDGGSGGDDGGEEAAGGDDLDSGLLPEDLGGSDSDDDDLLGDDPLLDDEEAMLPEDDPVDESGLPPLPG